MLPFNDTGLAFCTSYASHASHVRETCRLVVKPTRLQVQGGGNTERVGRFLCPGALPAPAFLLRQGAHQRATSHAAAQGMSTCRKSGATWWERMGEELLRECEGTGGASPQSKSQTPTPLPALAVAHQDCLKYLYFPSNYSWISLNSHLPLGIKLKSHLFPPAPTRVPCSIIWTSGRVFTEFRPRPLY